MVTKTLIREGHLIDSGLLSTILNLILQEGADYEVLGFDMGKVPDDESQIRLLLKAENDELLESVAAKLTALGVRAEGETEAVWNTVSHDKAAPDDFYSTTNHRTEVYIDGSWKQTSFQRMDAAINLRPVDRVPNAPFYEAPICRYFGADFRSALLQDRPMADAHLTALDTFKFDWVIRVS